MGQGQGQGQGQVRDGIRLGQVRSGSVQVGSGSGSGEVTVSLVWNMRTPSSTRASMLGLPAYRATRMGTFVMLHSERKGE